MPYACSRCGALVEFSVLISFFLLFSLLFDVSLVSTSKHQHRVLQRKEVRVTFVSFKTPNGDVTQAEGITF